MKKSYIKPDTQIVLISPMNPLLQADETVGVYGANASKDIVGTAMDANSGSFDEGEDWDVPSNRSLWDD